jgi:hypothetical protein
VAFLDFIDSLSLSDEEKDRLRREHDQEVSPLKNENENLKARDKRDSVESDVQALAALGFSDAPGLLKFVRRLYLSPTAEEPSAVLLSDSEMGLSGDNATGATNRETISAINAVRQFINLMPRNDKGKINLADVGVVDNAIRPEDGGEADSTEEHRANLAKITGRPIERTRKRYGVASVTAGGE